MACVLDNGEGVTGSTVSVPGDTPTDMCSFQAAIVSEHDVNLALVGASDRESLVFTSSNPFYVTWSACDTPVGDLWWTRKGTRVTIDIALFRWSHRAKHCVTTQESIATDRSVIDCSRRRSRHLCFL